MNIIDNSISDKELPAHQSLISRPEDYDYLQSAYETGELINLLQKRIKEFETVGAMILYSDARGQGTMFSEAMKTLKDLIPESDKLV